MWCWPDLDWPQWSDWPQAILAMLEADAKCIALMAILQLLELMLPACRACQVLNPLKENVPVGVKEPTDSDEGGVDDCTKLLVADAQ